MSRFLPDRFVTLMVASAILGFLLPELGSSDGPLRLGLVTKLGIAFVFFLHGANLAPENLISGVKNWKVHALIQANLSDIPDLGARHIFWSCASLARVVSARLFLPSRAAIDDIILCCDDCFGERECAGGGL